MTVAVDLDDGRINHGVFHVRIIRDSIENVCKNTRVNPVLIALEDGVPFAEMGGKITPGAACPGNPQYRFQKPLVVAATSSGVSGLAQTMWSHLRPLAICQNKSVHGKLLSELESSFN